MENINNIKNIIIDKVSSNGKEGWTSAIRSSSLINQVHELTKTAFLNEGVMSNLIFPPSGQSKPELKIAGFLKAKDQDIVIVPQNIPTSPRPISWGPLQFENQIDKYGEAYINSSIIVNVRSQLSSIAKNTDTLFERTFAEAVNLREIYPNVILGEVYMIPVKAFDQSKFDDNIIAFKEKVNLEKYISFFHSITANGPNALPYQYNRVALLIVDFEKDTPKVYESTQELIDDGLVAESFSLEIASISISSFAENILQDYSEINDLSNLIN